ncbi:MAG TPA: cysteine desulfurase family protein [Candidatus Saccharimonadales bacterium]|nr:cysteine desulfurase family protein [Candidatus Saccharimonadales bacterium]
MSIIYLDHAAATPMDPQVLVAMQPYFTEQFYNPSATYLAAQKVRKDLDTARAQVAAALGARPSEVFFTAGSTEGNNLAIRGIMDQYPQASIVVSSIEHESVLRTAHEYACREAPVTAQGIVDPEALLALIDDNTVLVSVMYANNEVGTVQPIRQISQALEPIRKARRQAGNALPLYLHTDAAQAAAYLDIQVARLGVDLLTLNGGKLYGPKQSGVLFAGSHVRLKPQITGGGQERGARSGTENVAGSIGVATALQLAQARRHDESQRLQGLQREFIQQLQAALPGVIINGSRKYRLPNNIHVTIPGQDNERLIFALDEAGILCAAGSACSASNEEPSHVLRAMGISEADAQSSLRFTMGRSTTQEAVSVVIQQLVALCSRAV